MIGVTAYELPTHYGGKLISSVQKDSQLRNNSYNKHITLFCNLALETSQIVVKLLKQMSIFARIKTRCQTLPGGMFPTFIVICPVILIENFLSKWTPQFLPYSNRILNPKSTGLFLPVQRRGGGEISHLPL